MFDGVKQKAKQFVSFCGKQYRKVVATLTGIAAGAYGSAYAQAEPEPVDIQSLGIDYTTTAGNFAGSVGGVVIAALGFMLALAVVHIFRRWIGAKKA